MLLRLRVTGQQQLHNNAGVCRIGRCRAAKGRIWNA